MPDAGWQVPLGELWDLGGAWAAMALVCSKCSKPQNAKTQAVEDRPQTRPSEMKRKAEEETHTQSQDQSPQPSMLDVAAQKRLAPRGRGPVTNTHRTLPTNRALIT